jgi:3-dehydroquinate dehydratase-2
MTIHIVNGPNLNQLGKREPSVYGGTTLDDIKTSVQEYAERLGVTVEFYQSNNEGSLIDHIQAAQDHISGMIINPGGLTHTSVSLRDCLSALAIPVVEVHISNIYARETFRQHSLMAPVVRGQITGLGWYGYLLAMDYLIGLTQRGEA